MARRVRLFRMKRPVLTRPALGHVIFDARTAAGLSQEALGRATGLGQTAISRIESGQRRLDSVELVHIAEALGVEAGELLAAAKNGVRRSDAAPDTPTVHHEKVADLLGQHDRATAEALRWIPPFLANLEKLERLGLDG